MALFALAVPPRAPVAEIDRVWLHVLEAKAGPRWRRWCVGLAPAPL